MSRKSGALHLGAAVMAILPGLAAAAPGDAATSADQLETITVNARRRDERVQDVPVAVTVLSQQALTDRNIGSINDLQYAVPSLGLNGYQRDSSFVAIRGQGGYAAGAASVSVITYLNDVPLQTNANGGTMSGAGLYFDLENAQILKGPQGTLFGRNTTGGAVLLQTKRPVDAFEGYVQAGIGNFSNREIEGVLNVPVVPGKLLVRIGGLRTVRDGFTRSLGTPAHPGGIDLDDVNSFAGRASIALLPSDRVRNDTILSLADNRSHGTSNIVSAVAPGSFASLFFPSVTGILATQRALGIRTQVPVDTDLAKHTRLLSATNITSIELADDLTLRNIAGASKLLTAIPSDGDGTALPILNYPQQVPQPLSQRQFTDEVQLLGQSFENRLNWIVGGFYYNNRHTRTYDPLNIVFGAPSPLASNDRFRSLAGYAQATYDLSDLLAGVKFTAGLRHTGDRLGAIGNRTNSVGATTWTLGLDYKPAESTLLYLTSRRGYRAGGFNPATLPARFQTYKSEYVVDIEAGIKTDFTLAGMPARVNGDFYWQDYQDLQATQDLSLLTGAPPPQEAITNAAGATIKGVEIEGSLRPLSGLQLGFFGSWIDFQYGRLPPQTSIRLPAVTNSPRFKIGLNGRYALLSDPAIGDVSIAGSWTWQSRANISVDPLDPLTVQAAYALATLSAHWDGIGGSPVDASAFVTNLANKRYAVADFAIYNTVGTSALVYGPPRMYGVRLRLRFGDARP